ncbi:MAG: hypothetical protein H6825_04495 [Planctomycetes bacterium]|nr:hypothetical protein [Planctomycetota bacterium]
MRVNIRKLKGLLWLLCVVVLALGCWTFWGIYQDKQTGRYESRKSTDIQKIFESEQSIAEAPPPTTYYPADARDSLWLARIDGTVEPPPAQPKDDSKTDDTPKKIVVPNLETVIDVSLIVSSDEPSGRFIAVEYDADLTPGGAAAVAAASAAGRSPSVAAAGAPPISKERRMHLAEGESLRPPWDGAPYNGRVEKISRQEVTFHWGEGEVVLRPQLGATGDATPLSEFDIPEIADVLANVEVQDERQVLPDGSILMGRTDLAAIREDAGKLLGEDVVAQSVTPDASKEGDSNSYILLKNVAPNSLAAKYGFKSGDHVISVNGIPMPSVTAAMNWAKANSDLPTYVVVYERLGQKVTATFHVK